MGIRRIPRNYSGKKPTGRSLSELLPKTLKRIEKSLDSSPDYILEAWPKIIGEKLAPMTRAISFHEGTLTVTVRSSTLLSLLVQHERAKLLKLLRDQFPNHNIQRIFFRIGNYVDD
ncbi:MAG: DUF721 domain-containing protein [Candidatus Algichlamydia australiensis]|nr:DUF721 domain-containing protein [Chlamydiales bacterium]